MATIVCPYCQNGFRDSVRYCPVCKEPFDYADWPVPEAYSPNGRSPHLTIALGDGSWSPRSKDFLIGKDPGPGGLLLAKPTVSRQHARVVLENGVWMLKSLGKPVEINGEPFGDGEFPLQTGDVIGLAECRLTVTVDYGRCPSLGADGGVLKNGGSVPLVAGQTVYIGSSTERCRIVIDGAAEVHAAIYYQRSSGSWWITDLRSEGGTKVNGEWIGNKQLCQGDKISVAGVDVVFELTFLRSGEVGRSGLDLAVRDVSAARKGFTILKDLHFSIRSGEFVGVLGPSGCGKSSLIQRLIGLGVFDSGTVTVNSQPYRGNEEKLRSVTSYVPQDVALHEDLSLDSEIAVFRKLHLPKSADDEARIQAALKLVGLDGKRGSRLGALSGGEKRRAAIALELLRDPRMLMLDEPTAGLDPATETEIMLYLRRIANQNRTVICSTHIMGNMRLFDKILFLSCGRMVFFGTPGELMNYFHVDSPLALYQRFGRGDRREREAEAERAARRFRESQLFLKYEAVPQSSAALPEAAAKPPAAQQVQGYLQRRWFEFFNRRHCGGMAIQMLVQPLLAAVVLKFACAEHFFGQDHYPWLLFFSAVSVFWLGFNNSIRELVHERTPWRCLERLEGVPLGNYLLGKLLWSLLLPAVQIGVFSLVLFALPDVGIIAATPLHFTSFDPLILVVFYLIGVLGSWIALAISAACGKENTAVSWMPLILIPILFFSDPIVRDDYGDVPDWPHSPSECTAGAGGKACKICQDRREGKYNLWAIRLERVMPCYEPEVLAAKITDRAARRGDWERMLCKTGMYALLALAMMIYFQNRNERNWDGR